MDSKDPLKAKREAVCRKNFDDLVSQLADYERSAEIWKQLDAAGTSLHPTLDLTLDLTLIVNIRDFDQILRRSLAGRH